MLRLHCFVDHNKTKNNYKQVEFKLDNLKGNYMATSLRGSAGSGKEKRGTSPSSSIIKKSPKPSSSNPNSSSSSPSDDKMSSSTDSSKPVPNYLKPTMSSSLDFSRLPRKSSTEASTAKPALNRRRSFDRPPPSLQGHKAIRGPPSVGVRDIKPQRSTSFSVKSTTPSASSSTKPAPEKQFDRTSSLKDGKAGTHLSKSLNVKKSTLSSTSTRKEPTSSSSSSAKKPPKSVTSESSVDYENRSVDHSDTVDDLVNMDYHEVQSLPEMSEMPESTKELADPTNAEVEEVKHLEEDPKEITLEEDHPHHEDKSTVIEQVLEEAAPEQESVKTDYQTVKEESADDQPKVEATEEQSQLVGAGDQQDESDKKVSEVGPTETVVEEMKEEKEEEPKEREAEKGEEEPKEREVEKGEEEPKERDAEKGEEETEAKDEKETVSSPPEDTAAPVKTQASAGKKDKQVYNDVIEETATKLMGKKNKVLALAGAFETVISLQDTNKS